MRRSNLISNCFQERQLQSHIVLGPLKQLRRSNKLLYYSEQCALIKTLQKKQINKIKKKKLSLEGILFKKKKVAHQQHIDGTELLYNKILLTI